MIIKTIRFRRKEDSKWEAGIAFEGNGSVNGIIIDSYDNVIGDPVNLFSKPIVYDAQDLTCDLCLDVDPIFDYINKRFNNLKTND